MDQQILQSLMRWYGTKSAVVAVQTLLTLAGIKPST
jgi:hypothetical protein